MSLADSLRDAIKTIPDLPNPGPYKLFAPGPQTLKLWSEMFPGVEVIPAYEVTRHDPR